MTGRQQWTVVGGVVLLLAVAAFTAMHFLRDELTSVGIGSDAPPFHAVTLDANGNAGAARSIASYRGDVVLLNIWATWCAPCRVEMPSIEALQKEMAPKGLKIVAVSIDQAGDEQKILDFVREYGLTFEVLHDSTGAIQQGYRTTGVPETFVIGRDGTIRRKWIGQEDWNSAEVKRLLATLLAEQRPVSMRP